MNREWLICRGQAPSRISLRERGPRIGVVGYGKGPSESRGMKSYDLCDTRSDKAQQGVRSCKSIVRIVIVMLR